SREGTGSSPNPADAPSRTNTTAGRRPTGQRATRTFIRNSLPFSSSSSRSQTPVWEGRSWKLRFPNSQRPPAHTGGETEFRGKAFPNRSLGTREARENGSSPGVGSQREVGNERRTSLNPPR